jgi:hypothetical protein
VPATKKENLIAGRGRLADAHLPLLVAGGDGERILRTVKAEFGVRVFAVQVGGAKTDGRKMFQRAEQRLDGGGLRGIGDRAFQLPAAVGADDGDFAGAAGNDLDFRHVRGVQPRQQPRPGAGGGLEIMLKNPDERGQRDREHEPDGGGFGFHAFCPVELAVAGGTSNIQLSAFNAQRLPVPARVGCSMLKVEG